MGCVAKAVKWIHSQDVQHRDLKPQNVLLRPGQVDLTDFGISRARASENTTTQSYYGHSAGYSAPEVSKMEDINPALADVYSLGCIYLHIVMVVHRGRESGATRKAYQAILMTEPAKREEEIERYLVEVLKLARVVVGDGTRHGYVLGIDTLGPTLYNDRRQRPSSELLDNNLWAAGGRHGQCCWSSSK